jgi:hypothetical protein
MRRAFVLDATGATLPHPLQFVHTRMPHRAVHCAALRSADGYAPVGDALVTAPHSGRCADRFGRVTAVAARSAGVRSVSLTRPKRWRRHARATSVGAICS